MANNFHLIDLVGQREAVREHLQGFTEEEMLRWLKAYGRLEEYYNSAATHQIYIFTSNLGIEAGFFFRKGQMIFIGDHYTFV
ncbi:hypothetical protein PN466_22615 [Roseofilum reptotaenium CS-1145]|uniref:Uncharacterized protein n=1 Tax=Roseofilum reptotaenium AO1-A TaxID=1925591 RepID=A0A1L9QTF2_9CYAN|nr:hypothetical protein [Roseofilum reptotaenium]MDB9519740.1 hypothetical protein [Roseofilum reptotaenium CS-1145]OJJ25906.1 hypothetical protein BI308_09230 [Roseofilum reptotaenium AO1-A]